MLSIKILNGLRQNIVLELYGTSISQNNPIILREDDVLQFEATLKEDLPNLVMVLHDSEISFTRRYEKDGFWIYEWHPKEIYNRKESFFHNYCGIAEISLTAKKPETSDFIYFFELHPIEILAKKINADRISAMFDFMAREDGKDLAGALRITRMRAGYKEGGHTETFLLERIEHNLAFLNKILPSIGSKPIVKLGQVSCLVVPNQDTLIDEKSLSWVAENPDSLYPASSVDESFLSFEGEHFCVSQIVESQTKTSCDIYENQVLHGFVVTLITETKNIQRRLQQDSRAHICNSMEFEGYVSFFSQLNKFSGAINKNKIDKCSRLIRELNQVFEWLKRIVPVKKINLGIPRFTQKAKYNLFYQQLFHRTIAWYKYGAPDWGVQDELNSIRDIPRLFEYYLLCVIKYHLENMGSTDLPVTQVQGSIQSDKFEYKWSGASICLMYEPEIWMEGHSHSKSMNLINTEGWTLKSRDGGGRAVDFSKRGSTGRYSNRCPDLMIEVSKANAESSYFIIDAKYTDSKRAFLSYLPELTMKYIHGIHQQASGKNLSSALMIVNPDETPNTRHFHHHKYSVYGEFPIIPALLVTSIDVSTAHDVNSNLRSDLTRVLELMVYL